jgi:hypothetical protein
MIAEANIQNLMRLVKNNERARRFDLSLLLQHDECGTIGCLVGNDYIAEYNKTSYFSVADVDRTQIEYGISPQIWDFLFSNLNTEYNYGLYEIFGEKKVIRICKQRDHLDKEAAIKRVLKFIYYVLHKRELLYDDSGRIRETARRQEGNHNVLKQVKEKVLAY